MCKGVRVVENCGEEHERRGTGTDTTTKRFRPSNFKTAPIVHYHSLL